MAIQHYRYVPQESENGFPVYFLETDDADFRCEKCQGPMRLKGYTRSKDDPREIYDYDPTEKGPVKILYRPKQYRCSYCNTVVPDPYAPELPGGSATDDFRILVAQDALSRSDKNSKQIAEKYDVSPSFVTRAVTDHLEEIKNTIASYLPCSELWIKQYTYMTEECYAVIGYSGDLRKWVLLNVIQAADHAQLTDLYEKVAKPARIHCPADPSFIQDLIKLFPAAALMVGYQDYCDALDRELQRIKRIKSQEDYLAAWKMVSMIKTELKAKRPKTIDDCGFFDDLYCDEMVETAIYDPDISIFRDLLALLPYLIENFKNDDTVPEPVERATRLLQKYSKSRVPFDAMCLRLLYHNDFFRYTQQQQKQMRYSGAFYDITSSILRRSTKERCYTIIPELD